MVLTQMDIEWAKSVAGCELTVAEIIELKTEFEDWLDQKEKELTDG